MLRIPPRSLVVGSCGLALALAGAALAFVAVLALIVWGIVALFRRVF